MFGWTLEEKLQKLRSVLNELNDLLTSLSVRYSGDHDRLNLESKFNDLFAIFKKGRIDGDYEKGLVIDLNKINEALEIEFQKPINWLSRLNERDKMLLRAKSAEVHAAFKKVSEALRL